MKYIALFLSIILSACSSTGTGGLEPSKKPVIRPTHITYLSGTPQWDTMADVKRDLKSNVTISGNRVNLNGGMISGKNIKHPKNSQDEDSIALRIHIDNFTLENGIISDIPGGIIYKGKNSVFRGLKFINAGEDFISTPRDKAEGITITNCKFYNNRAGDKSIQLNAAKDALIAGCYITGGVTGIRIQESTSKVKDITAKVFNNTFDNLDTGVNVNGHTTLLVRDNKFINVKTKYNDGPHTKIKEY